MNELKRCPFCGGEAYMLECASLDKRIGYFIECGYVECGVFPKTSIYGNPEDVIKAWNTRKPMEKILKRLKEEKNALYNARSKYRKAMFNNDDAFNKCKVLHEKEMSINEAIKIAKEEGGIE